MGYVAKKLNLQGIMRDPPKLSLPGKLVFPSLHHRGHFSMLGLGDIVMPGLLLCFVLRYDTYKRLQFMPREQDAESNSGVPGASNPPDLPSPSTVTNFQRVTYFHCSLLGYCLGLLTATLSAEVFKAAQPALLYLVPFTLLPLFIMAYLKGLTVVCPIWHTTFIILGDLKGMWNDSLQAINEKAAHASRFQII